MRLSVKREVSRDLLCHLEQRKICCSFACNDKHVAAGFDIMAQLAKTFSHQALDPIAHYRISYLGTYRYTQASFSSLGRLRDDHKIYGVQLFPRAG